MEMNIPQKIKSMCPNITAIIDENIKFWSKVELVYLKRIEYIKNAAEEKNFISLRKSLIDDMILFRNERIKLDAFLRDIDLKAKTIYDSIHDDKQKIETKSNI